MANPHFHFLFIIRGKITPETINFVHIIHLFELKIQFFVQKNVIFVLKFLANK